MPQDLLAEVELLTQAPSVEQAHMANQDIRETMEALPAQELQEPQAPLEHHHHHQLQAQQEELPNPHILDIKDND